MYGEMTRMWAPEMISCNSRPAKPCSSAAERTRMLVSRTLRISRAAGGAPACPPPSPTAMPRAALWPEEPELTSVRLGLTYTFARVDLFASYLAYVAGTDTHVGRALTIGFSVPFQIRGARR